MKIIPIRKNIRIIHIPQVGVEKSFKRLVVNEFEANSLINALADQHLFLSDNNFIPTYSNAFYVEMETRTGWEDYYNDKMGMDWEELNKFL